MTQTDIQRLDDYMKRCKLGPFRLERALQLAKEGTPASQKDLADMRTKAGFRLQYLRKVQQQRLKQDSLHNSSDPPRRSTQRSNRSKAPARSVQPGACAYLPPQTCGGGVAVSSGGSGS